MLDSVNGFINFESCDLSRGVLGEFLVSQLDSANGFVGGVFTVNALDFPLKVGFQIVDSLCFQPFMVGVYFGNDNLLGGIVFMHALVDNDLVYAADALDIALDFLGVDILTVRENDEIFHAAGDVEPLIAVELSDITDVTGVEVAVLIDNLTGGFFIFKVAEHNVGAAVTDFTFAFFIGSVDFDLAADDGETDRAVFAAFIAVAGDERCTFGNAVAVENDDTDAFKKVDD